MVNHNLIDKRFFCHLSRQLETAKKSYHMACKEEKLASTREANGKSESSVTADQLKKLHEKVDKCKLDSQKVRTFGRFCDRMIDANTHFLKGRSCVMFMCDSIPHPQPLSLTLKVFVMMPTSADLCCPLTVTPLSNDSLLVFFCCVFCFFNLQAKDKYEKSLDELNKCTPQYMENMEQVFEQSQQFEEKRLCFLREVLLDIKRHLNLTEDQRFDSCDD